MTGEWTLVSLIDLAFDRHQTSSGAKLARIARDNEFKIVATTINHIRAGTYRPRPGKQTLEALAFLAGVPPRVAYDAAGLPAPGPPFAQELPDGVDYLSPKERDLVIRLCRVLLDRHELDIEKPEGHKVGTSELRKEALRRTGGNSRLSDNRPGRR